MSANLEAVGSLFSCRQRFSGRVGDSFSLWDGMVSGNNVELVIGSLLVQRWRCNDWPEGHFATIRYEIEPCSLDRFEGTRVLCVQRNLPSDRMRDVKQRQRLFWRKLHAEPVESIQQTVYFREPPSDIFEMFQRCGNASGFLAVGSLVRQSDMFYSLFRLNEWPPEHYSKLKIDLMQLGDRDVRTKKETKLSLLWENVPAGHSKELLELWDRFFWRRMNGVVSADTLRYSIIFNFVSPSELYENLLNFSKFTKKRCEFTDQIGEEFHLFNDLVRGKNLKLMKNRIIFQRWRFSDWPEGHWSTVRFLLKELVQRQGKERAITTKLLFTQEGIPLKCLSNVRKFWEKFWTKFRNSKGGIAEGTKAHVLDLTKKAFRVSSIVPESQR